MQCTRLKSELERTLASAAEERRKMEEQMEGRVSVCLARDANPRVSLRAVEGVEVLSGQQERVEGSAGAWEGLTALMPPPIDPPTLAPPIDRHVVQV